MYIYLVIVLKSNTITMNKHDNSKVPFKPSLINKFWILILNKKELYKIIFIILIFLLNSFNVKRERKIQYTNLSA